ncbi:transcription factor jun-B [Tachyglossus aculeatus]|uniref:transcription factor jun-B n=1 Tax=Tachyglossus aculeatus TaxID=9261 RepID=UPI0018F648FF|nr:transcription factor jun-B [Tachyglossus aculeatus]
MCTKMEQPFYHDDSYPTPGYVGRGPGGLALQDYKLLKHNLALNLSDPYRGLKSHLQLRGQGPPAEDSAYFAAQQQQQQQQQQQDTTGAGGSLKLASPELERLIIQNSNGVITTTPTPPGQYFYPRGVTEEQEGFADGFVKALDDLHKMNHVGPPNVSIGAGGAGGPAPPAPPSSSVYGASSLPEPPPVYTNLTSYNPVGGGAGGSGGGGGGGSSSYPTATISYLPHAPPFAGGHPAGGALGLGPGAHPGRGGPAGGLASFKEEPQTVPEAQSRDGTPPMSPINMEDQERIKVERKRLRNRLAATKCRKRKLERIARLEDKVKSLKTENAGLSNTASLLREQVAQLKQKVMNHVNNGCQLLLTVKMQNF